MDGISILSEAGLDELSTGNSSQSSRVRLPRSYYPFGTSDRVRLPAARIAFSFDDFTLGVDDAPVGVGRTPNESPERGAGHGSSEVSFRGTIDPIEDAFLAPSASAMALPSSHSGSTRHLGSTSSPCDGDASFERHGRSLDAAPSDPLATLSCASLASSDGGLPTPCASHDAHPPSPSPTHAAGAVAQAALDASAAAQVAAHRAGNSIDAIEQAASMAAAAAGTAAANTSSHRLHSGSFQTPGSRGSSRSALPSAAQPTTFAWSDFVVDAAMLERESRSSMRSRTTSSASARRSSASALPTSSVAAAVGWSVSEGGGDGGSGAVSHSVGGGEGGVGGGRSRGEDRDGSGSVAKGGGASGGAGGSFGSSRSVDAPPEVSQSEGEVADGAQVQSNAPSAGGAASTPRLALDAVSGGGLEELGADSLFSASNDDAKGIEREEVGGGGVDSTPVSPVGATIVPAYAGKGSGYVHSAGGAVAAAVAAAANASIGVVLPATKLGRTRALEGATTSTSGGSIGSVSTDRSKDAAGGSEGGGRSEDTVGGGPSTALTVSTSPRNDVSPDVGSLNPSFVFGDCSLQFDPSTVQPSEVPAHFRVARLPAYRGLPPPRHIQISTRVGFSGRVKCLSLAPSGRCMAVASAADPGVMLADGTGLSVTATLRGHTDAVMSIQFSNDGQLLATTSRDRTVIIWSVPLRRQELILVHARIVLCCAFCSTGHFVVTGCQDRLCRVWATRTGREVVVFRGHRGLVTGVSVSPSAPVVASSSSDHRVLLWGLETGHVLCELHFHKGVVLTCQYALSGQALLSVDEDAIVVTDVSAPDAPHTVSTIYASGVGNAIKRGGAPARRGVKQRALDMFASSTASSVGSDVAGRNLGPRGGRGQARSADDRSRSRSAERAALSAAGKDGPQKGDSASALPQRSWSDPEFPPASGAVQADGAESLIATDRKGGEDREEQKVTWTCAAFGPANLRPSVVAGSSNRMLVVLDAMDGPW